MYRQASVRTMYLNVILIFGPIHFCAKVSENQNNTPKLPCNIHERKLKLKTILRKCIQLLSRFTFACINSEV